MILIVDNFSLKIVSRSINMSEIVQEGIISIEKLEFGRKPYPQLDAIYFIQPFGEQVKLLKQDFEDDEDPQYQAAHVFFLNNLDRNLMIEISKDSKLMKRIKTFKEFNLDYLCIEDNIFSFNLPKALPIIFSKFDLDEEKKMTEDIALKLSSLLPAFDYS